MCTSRNFSLRPDSRVALSVIRTPLAVADDRQLRPTVGEHCRADVAGMRSFLGAMHILPADGEGGNGA